MQPNTAKNTFIDSPHRAEFERVAKSDAFKAACQYALLALFEEMPPATNPANGWDSHSQLCGARRFADILQTLHEPVKELRPPSPPTLNYNVGVEKR